MPEHEVRHPLSWGRFYAECFRYAASGILGVIGDAGTVIGIVLVGFKLGLPAYYTRASDFLLAHGYRENALIEIPLWVGGSILLARLCTAPFILYRDKPSLPLMTENASLADNPASSVVAPTPKLVLSYGERDKHPFSVRNDGTETACNVRIDTLPGRFGFFAFITPGNVPTDGKEHPVRAAYPLTQEMLEADVIKSS